MPSRYPGGSYRRGAGRSSASERFAARRAPGGSQNQGASSGPSETVDAEPLAWGHPHFAKPSNKPPMRPLNETPPGGWRPVEGSPQSARYDKPVVDDAAPTLGPLPMSLGELVPLGRALAGLNPLSDIALTLADVIFEWGDFANPHEGYVIEGPDHIPGYALGFQCPDPAVAGCVIRYGSGSQPLGGCFIGQGFPDQEPVVGNEAYIRVWRKQSFGAPVFCGHALNRWDLLSQWTKVTGTTTPELQPQRGYVPVPAVLPDWLWPMRQPGVAGVDPRVKPLTLTMRPNPYLVEQSLATNGFPFPRPVVRPRTRNLPSIYPDVSVRLVGPTTIRTRRDFEEPTGRNPKVRVLPPVMRLLHALMGQVLEVGDYVEALFDALPAECKKGKSRKRVDQMVEALLDCGSNIDPAQAIANLMLNQLEDAIIGAGAKQKAKAIADAGVWAPSAGGVFGGNAALGQIGVGL